MPLLLILGVPLLFTTGALALNSVADDADKAVSGTGVNLALLAVGAFGIWAAFKIIQKG